MESSRRRFIKPVVAGLALAGVLSGIALVPMLNGSAQADEADGAPARVRFLEPGTTISNPATDQFGVTLPEVLIKEDGTLVQRTPSFATSVSLKDGYGGEVEVGASGNLLGWTDPEVSMKYQNADLRGCGACHEDLASTVVNGISGTFAHPLLTSGLDVELTVSTCDHCHHVANRTASFIHNIHMVGTGNDIANCFTCHELDPNTMEWDMWDEVKYDMLEGITPIDAADVVADISFTQDKVIPTEELFNIGWNDSTQSESFNMDTANGKQTETDPALFDAWEITVFGDGVKQEMSWTLPELIEQAPSVTTQMTSVCIDDRSMGLIGNVEVKGIPVQWLFEQAGLTEDAAAMTVLNSENAPDMVSAAHALNFDDTIIGTEFPDRQLLLVYEINGERLSVADGYPVAFWSGADKAARNQKQVTAIRVDTTPQANFENPMGKNGNYADMGIVGLDSGTCIQAGEPFTIEGYAFGFARPLEKLQFSMDNGATWTDLDVSDATADKWVWWTYTFTPPADVTTSYVLQVRAVAEDGSVTGFEPDGTEVVAPLRVMVNAKADLDAFRDEVMAR